MSQAGELNVVNNHPEIPTSFITDSGTAVPIANEIEILGAGGTSTSATANIITITSVLFTWNIVTSGSNPVIFVKDTGYISKGAGVVQFQLPPAASVGDSYRIIGYGNLWTIAQNAGQSIRIGSFSTTPGVTGSVTATMVTDCLELVCVTANLEFYCPTVQGNPTLA